MQKNSKKIIVRVLVILPYLLFLYILQGMVFPRLPVFGSVPLLLPMAVVGIAIYGGRISGGAFGLLAGMLCDLSFNQPTIQFTLILTFLGLFIGYLSDTVIVTGFPSYIVCSLGVLLVSGFFQAFRPLFFESAPFRPLLSIGLRQTVVSLLFVIPMYYLNRFVSRAF